MKKLSLESMFITIISVGFFILLYIGIQFETHRKEWLLQGLAVLTILLMLLSSWRIWRPAIIKPKVEEEERPPYTQFSKLRKRVNTALDKLNKKIDESPYADKFFYRCFRFDTVQMALRYLFSLIVSGVLAMISLCILLFAEEVTPIKRERLVPFFVGPWITWAVIMVSPFLIHFVITVIRSERIEKEKKAKDHY